jgi:hypothetical protein
MNYHFVSCDHYEESISASALLLINVQQKETYKV